MYLTSLNARQVGEASGLTCPVLIEWEYGNQLPDIVEIYSDGAKVAEIDVVASLQQKSTTVSLPAGTLVQVHVCGRLFEQETLPDETGREQYWKVFCLWQSLVTKALPGTGEVIPDPPKPAPRITSAYVIPASAVFLAFPMPVILKQRNKIRVSWASAQAFGAFLVRWNSNYDNQLNLKWDARKHSPLGGEVRVDGEGKSGSFELEGVLPGLEYEFVVKGRDSGFFGWKPIYSEWSSPQKITVPENLDSLRQYMQLSNLDTSQGIRKYLFVDAGSIKSFMQR